MREISMKRKLTVPKIPAVQIRATLGDSLRHKRLDQRQSLYLFRRADQCRNGCRLQIWLETFHERKPVPAERPCYGSNGGHSRECYT